MKHLNFAEVVDAVSSMRALEQVLADELCAIETCIEDLNDSGAPLSDSELEDRETYVLARAAIHGCLASITDVLGWVNLMAKKGGGSDVILLLESLPDVPRHSIN